MRDKGTVTTAFEAAWPLMLSYVTVGLAYGVLAAKAGMAPWMSTLLGFTYLSGGGQSMISNLWIADTLNDLVLRRRSRLLCRSRAHLE